MAQVIYLFVLIQNMAQVIYIFVLIQNPFLTHHNFITLTWISQTQFGYDVNEVDIYGNPNVHSRTEVREGPHVKGEAIINFNDRIVII